LLRLLGLLGWFRAGLLAGGAEGHFGGIRHIFVVGRGLSVRREGVQELKLLVSVRYGLSTGREAKDIVFIV
jgi:hypothetical protein